MRLIEFERNASDIKRTLIDRTPKIVEHFLIQRIQQEIIGFKKYILLLKK